MVSADIVAWCMQMHPPRHCTYPFMRMLSATVKGFVRIGRKGIYMYNLTQRGIMLYISFSSGNEAGLFIWFLLTFISDPLLDGISFLNTRSYYVAPLFVTKGKNFIKCWNNIHHLPAFLSSLHIRNVDPYWILNLFHALLLGTELTNGVFKLFG